MSTTIDQKVLEMRFDNAQFERGVSTTMSTLDKLKQKLSFSGASKGLSELDSAAKKVDMTGLGNSVEKVGLKFDAMQIMGITALTNITNSAVNAGKRIVSALTIDPIKTGFQEYETQINAVQTILANTQSKGSTIDDVNKALDELNKYADLTIYNFTEMTRNIGTFTAAGIELETSVSAIQGIANLAAVSGSTSQQASTAMYQLSQALAAGTVKLMDWNSVVNAGMGGQIFQDALKKTSELLGTGAEAAIKAKGSFRESLQTGWLTAEVLTETLKKFTTSGANEYVAEYTGLSKEAVSAALEEAKAKYGEAEAIEYASKALAEKSGKNADEIKSALEMARTAEDAATKVKTFTQLWDVLKEAAQSGWSKTWQIIIGDFEEAKALLTPLADFFTEIINKISDARNILLENALTKNFKHLLDTIGNTTKPIKDTVDTITESLKDYDKVVNEIIAGKWGNTEKRWNALTEAGYDWAHAQNLVNEKLGDSTRHATNYKEAQEGVNKAQEEGAETSSELTEADAKRIAELAKMSDAQLKSLGYTDKQIEAFRELVRVADQLGLPLEEFITNIDEINGRWLIINSFKNVGQSLVKIFKAIGDAWNDAFGLSEEEAANRLFNVIAAIHKFTTYLKMSDKTAEALTSTLKGLFAILDIIGMVTGSVFKVAFKILQEIVKALNLPDLDTLVYKILSVTGAIGEAIAKFRDWLEEHNLIYRAIEVLVPMVVNLGKAIVGLVEGFLKLPAVQFAIEQIRKAFEALSDLFSGPLKAISTMVDTLSGLDKVSLSDINNALYTMRKSISASVREWLDKHPKVEAAVEKTKELFVALGEKMASAFDKWLDKHPKVQSALESIKGALGGFGSAITMFKNIGSGIYDVVSAFLNMESFDFSDIKNVFSSIGEIISSEFSKWLNKFPKLKQGLSDIGSALSKFGNSMLEAFRSLTKPISDVIEYLKSLDSISLEGILHAFDMLKDGFANLFSGGDNISGDFVDGLVLGLRNAGEKIWAAMAQLGKDMLEAIKGVLGIHSPSTEGEAIGGYFIQGLINGLKNGSSKVLKTLSDLSTDIIDFFLAIDWKSIIAGGIAVGITIAAKKLSDVIGAFSSPLSGLGDIFSGVGEVLSGAGKVLAKSAGKIRKILNNVAKVVKSFSKAINRISRGISFKMTAAGLKDIAIGIAILAASVYLLTTVDDIGKLWNAVGVIGALATILVLLAIACNKMSQASTTISKDGIKKSGVTGTLIALGVTLLAMAAVVKIVGSMNVEDAIQGFVGLGLMVAAIAAVLAVFGKCIKNYNAMVFNKLGGMLIKMSIAMLLLAAVCKIIAGMEWGDMGKAAAGLGGLVAIMALMMLISKMDTPGAGGTFLKIVASLAILVIVAKMLAGMEWGDMGKAAVGLMGLVGIMALMMLVSKIGNSKKIGTMLLQMAAAIATLAVVVTRLSRMSWEELAKAGVGLLGLVGIMALLMYVSKIGNTKKIGTMLMQMAGTMAILAVVCKIMGTMEWSELGKAAVGMALLVAVMTGLVAATQLVGKKKLEKLAGTLLVMSIAIGILAGVALLLSLIDIAGLAKGVVAVGFLGAIMSMMILATKNAKEAKGSIMAMAVAIGILAVALIALSFIDPKKLVAPTIAMGLLMGMFALILKSSKSVTKSMKSLIVMTVAIGLLAGILALLTLLPVEETLGTAIALSTLMLALSASLRLISSTGKDWKGALKGIGLLTAMVVPLAVFAIALSLLPDVSGTRDNIITLVALMTAMTLLLVPLTLIGTLGGAGALLGVLALTAMVVPLAVFAIALNKIPDVSGSIETVKLLVTLMTAMTLLLIPLTVIGYLAVGALLGVLALTSMVIPLIVFAVALNKLPDLTGSIANVKLLMSVMDTMTDILVKLAPLAPLAIVGVAAITALSGVMAAFGVLATAIGALIDKFPSIQKFLDTGLPVLEQLAGSIGNMIGKFVGGILTGVGTAILQLLPQLGMALSAFMVGLQPFIALASNVDSSVVTGAGYLTAAILCLTVADFIAGIGQFLNGGVSFADLGVQLMSFGVGAMAFFDTIKNVDQSAVEAATNVANMLLVLTASEFLSSITEFLGGSVDFSEMGEKLKAFGEAVVGFSQTISGNIDVAAVEAATNAGQLLVQLNKSLPRSGGWIQDIIGEQDFEQFAISCKAFAECILDINNAVSQEGFVLQSEKIAQLVTAGTQFSDLNNALPRTGGIAQDIAGEKDLVGFGESCKAFAKCMMTVSESVSQEGFVVQSDKIAQLVDAGTKFNELNTALPKTGGIAQDLAGEKDLATFGLAVAAFAGCMVAVNTALSQEGFAVNLEGMEGLKQAGLKMNELQSVLPKSGGWWQDIAGEKDIGDFGSKISQFADAIVDFSTSATGLDSAGINLAITTAYRIKSLITSLSDLDTSGLATFTGIGTGGIGADGAAYKIAQAIAAFSDKVSDIKTDAVTVAVSAAQKLKSLIAGLVGLDTSGIENFKPESIGKAMKSYNKSVEGMDTSSVSSSISAANRLKNFIASLASLDVSGIGKFNVNSIGSTLKKYAASVAGFNIDAVNSSISAATRLKSFVNSLANVNTNGVGSFKKAIDELSTVNIAGLVKAFSNASPQMLKAGGNLVTSLTKGITSKQGTLNSTANKLVTMLNKAIVSKNGLFNKAGLQMMTAFAKGINSGRSKASSAMVSAASNAISKIRSKYTSFYSAGSYLVSGFASGISANTWRAEAKAKAMANAAEQAARKALKINSPSKVFIKIGAGIPEGFAKGIEKLGGLVTGTTKSMANTAINSTKKAMSRVADALNSDIDSQPTIRPVLDLSSVTEGAGTISSLLNTNPSVGVMANVSAINSSMNSRSQNGINSDIISAIRDLKDTLGGLSGDTYTINGITYDDGSNISEAVKSITRAARMERRI